MISFVLWYFYLVATGSKEDKKGWTFVEWIFDEVSYLPYLQTDDQSAFYQKFLFRSCLNLYKTDEDWHYAQDLCKVYTDDNQNYILKIIDEDAVWSDWSAVTIEDVFFTYDQILRQNRREVSSLNTWNSITVSLEDWKVKVSFPTMNPDNLNFFVNPILPKHIVEWMDLNTYKNYFSLAPVMNWCAKIMSQTKDVNSLIFDVNDCDDTHFSYYQIKNYGSFEDFNKSLEWTNHKAIIDAYESNYSLEWFTWYNVLTSKLLWVFFNTDSWKASVRLRRSIWWLIYNNFFTWNYKNYISEYDWEFLNYYVSAWENVAELLSRLDLEEWDSIDTNDLKDSWAQELPSSMSINWVDRKFVFFMQKPEKAFNLDIKFSNEFSNIKVVASSDKSVRSPKNYNSKNKKISYTLTSGKNLNVWVNNFTISGVIKNKTYTIASIDVYVFENLSTSKNVDNQRKLSVLYYNDQPSLFAIQQMREIFSSAWILDNFIFEPVYNPEELEWKLLMWTYDMYVWTVDLWSRKDVLTLFWTEDPLLNPSRYRNPILTSLINQYRKNLDWNVQREINVLLAQDMPLVFLWNTYDVIQLQDKVKDDVFSPNEEIDWETQDTYAYKWRYDIYSKYSIVHGVRVNKENAFNFDNLKDFIISLLLPRDSKILNDDLNFLEDSNWEEIWSKFSLYEIRNSENF